MMILQKWRENRERILRVGEAAIERARKAGLPAYYQEGAEEAVIVKEMPDGRRLAVGPIDREDVVKAAFGRRG